ncbi:hypothetical protein B5F07_13060 [Lachnoclostridium sp. An169]|uniref:hypothetical protein n=1 Tax=Lachnoclostridium sp. An169 TaxID=1965569 RepID=UPI000B370545|nr:hypothetical protein [Lachnoclostridium sp. An169]OUP82673.1 hypothetical protein B5F07_13060 [Lachnoclostridium sp. An169]
MNDKYKRENGRSRRDAHVGKRGILRDFAVGEAFCGTTYSTGTTTYSKYIVFVQNRRYNELYEYEKQKIKQKILLVQI